MPVDYEKLSDDALKQIAGGKVDYDTLSDDDLKVIAGSSYESDTQKRVREGGSTAASLRKFAEGGTGGYYDEIAGAVDTIGDIPSIVTGKKSLGDAYRGNRDHYRGLLKETEKQFPSESMAAKTTGLVMSPISKLKRLPVAGGIIGLGESEADLTKGEFGKAAIDAGLGGAGGWLGGKVVEKVAAPIASSAKGLLSKVGGGLREFAGNLAEKATGATRAQAEKFAPGAGKQLLDRGVVRFGATPKAIAERSQSMMDDAAAAMDDVLSEFDARGVKATSDKVLGELNKRIAKLNSRGGTRDQAVQLEKVRDQISEALGKNPNLLSVIEAEKRSWGKVNWQNPDNAVARKEAYRALMDTTEEVAREADAGLAGVFKEGKETYGLLAPIQEAAEKRAIQLNQSPIGGLLDMTSIGAGFLSGNEEAGAILPILRRGVAPRLASSGAVTANQAAKAVNALAEKSPQAAIELAKRLGFIGGAKVPGLLQNE